MKTKYDCCSGLDGKLEKNLLKLKSREENIFKKLLISKKREKQNKKY